MRFHVAFAVILSVLFFHGDLGHAQQLAVGVKGGIRTTDDTSGSLSSESKRNTIGPMLDVRLPFRLGVEFDAFYQRFGFTGYANSCCGSSVTRERANS